MRLAWAASGVTLPSFRCKRNRPPFFRIGCKTAALELLHSVHRVGGSLLCAHRMLCRRTQQATAAGGNEMDAVKSYFNTTGFERWNKIYGETDEVNKVRRLTTVPCPIKLDFCCSTSCMAPHMCISKGLDVERVGWHLSENRCSWTSEKATRRRSKR